MNVCGYVRVSSDGQPAQEPELSFEDAKKIFEGAKKNFADTFTVEQQRVILHSLIKKIVLKDDEIQIYWRFE